MCFDIEDEISCNSKHSSRSSPIPQKSIKKRINLSKRKVIWNSKRDSISTSPITQTIEMTIIDLDRMHSSSSGDDDSSSGDDDSSSSDDDSSSSDDDSSSSDDDSNSGCVFSSRTQAQTELYGIDFDKALVKLNELSSTLLHNDRPWI
ncbi:hypothetical protein YC2023_094264 [Brassica napus]